MSEAVAAAAGLAWQLMASEYGSGSLLLLRHWLAQLFWFGVWLLLRCD
jgi:hypothetical protein